MKARSLRDEISRGVVARTRRKGRPLKGILISGSAVLALVLAIAVFGGTDPSAEDADTYVDTGQSELTRGDSGDSLGASDPETQADEPKSVDLTDSSAEENVSEIGGQTADVLSELDALPVVSDVSESTYDRALFGQTWFDEDRNGCDTRNDILRRDLIDTTFKDNTNGCKVLSGTLEDWYSGTTVAFTSGGDTSRLVQVDHIVPLAWAWRHGADGWSDEQRRSFANDPLNLTATTDQENQRKSDKGPNEWLPSNDQAQCRYVQRFTKILSEYDLGINLHARAMIRGVLFECADSTAFGELVSGDVANGGSR